jgi:hypothetical protein
MKAKKTPAARIQSKVSYSQRQSAEIGQKRWKCNGKGNKSRTNPRYSNALCISRLSIEPAG